MSENSSRTINSSNAGPFVPSDEISLKQLILSLRDTLKYLLSKWKIIVLGGITGVALGMAYAYSKKPFYKAEMTFVLESGKQGGAASGYAGLASQFGFDLGSSAGGVFEGQNLLALMSSRLMIEKALLTTVRIRGKEETLAEYYIDMKKLREKWASKNLSYSKIRFLPGADPSKFSLDQNSIISGFHGELIRDNLFLGSKDKKSGILVISVTSEDELFSKYFTEVLAREVSNFYIETKIKKVKRNVATLKNQVDSVRREFNSAISGAASSMDANPNANAALQRTLQVPSQRRQIDAQANQAMLLQLMQNLAMSQNSLREETPLIQIIDQPVLPLPVEQFSKSTGAVLGGLLATFIIVCFLVIRRVLLGVMAGS